MATSTKLCPKAVECPCPRERHEVRDSQISLSVLHESMPCHADFGETGALLFAQLVTARAHGLRVGWPPASILHEERKVGRYRLSLEVVRAGCRAPWV